MQSPFPGMDPYVEGPAFWPDFHSRFVNVLSEMVADRLPPNYQAGLNEQVLLIEPETDAEIGPDVAVLRQRDSTEGESVGATSAVGLLAPHTIPNLVRLDPHVEVFIEIRYLGDQELITVLEVLSPSNKTGTGRGQYIEKREALLHRRVNLVELDLLRGGTRLRLARPLPPGDYYTFVSRGDRWPDCDVYNWTVHHPLPPIPIPLRAPDADVEIPLAEAFQEAYKRGRYDRRVRYFGPPPAPKFNSEDANWVAQIAQAANRKEPGHA